MQTTNQKEGIDIVEGTEIITNFLEIKEVEGFYEDGIGYKVKTFSTKTNFFESHCYGVPNKSFAEFVNESKYHLSFEWLIPAVRCFNDLDPIPAFPQWVTWCEQINNTLIKTYEPLPVFYVLVEAVKDYNLHATGH